MKLLLDTHTFVWSLLKVGRLSAVASAAITAADGGVYVSVASIWEISIKVGLGKWPEAEPLLVQVESLMAMSQFEILLISLSHVRVAGLMTCLLQD